MLLCSLILYLLFVCTCFAILHAIISSKSRSCPFGFSILNKHRPSGLHLHWCISWYCTVVPCEAQIQEKLHKNHIKSYYIPITHSASLSDHPWDIILWKRQRNCFNCNIIAQIPHSDHCQPSKMNKYSESIECQSKHHHMTHIT